MSSVVFHCYPPALSPNLAFPYLASFVIGNQRRACATGFSHNIAKSAAGEALERLFSYSRAGPPDLKLKFIELDSDVREHLSIVSSNYEANDLINCVRASRLKSGRLVSVPQVFTTLAKHPDDYLMPYRDSSGFAFHTNPVQARTAALHEFAERQGLSAFWYYGHCNAWTEVDPGGSFPNMQIQRMIEHLCKTGRIILSDTSMFDGSHSIIACYFSHSESVGPFFASAGAASEIRGFALEKALMECYQALVLMNQVSNPVLFEHVHDKLDILTLNYLKYNRPKLLAEFPFDAKLNLDWIKFMHGVDRKLMFPLISDDIIVATKKVSFSSKEHGFLIRIFGLNWFPFMTGEKHINIFDIIASKRNLKSRITSEPIPFS